MSETAEGPRGPGITETPLNGWKEIAGFFAKGVRTVQRWEREMGLPVHRVLGPRGESVFAFVKELEAWREQQERGRLGSGDEAARGHLADESAACRSAPGWKRSGAERAGNGSAGDESLLVPPASEPAQALESTEAYDAVTDRRSAPPPRRPARAAMAALIAGALVLAGLVGAALVGWPAVKRGSGVPSRWEVRGNALIVSDERGVELWVHRFPGSFVSGMYDGPAARWVHGFADIDHDGQVETLFFAIHLPPQRSVFYCFDARGGIRFTRTLNATRRFGTDVYAGPWQGYRFLSHVGRLERGEIWLVWTHGIEFPSVLERLSPRGEVLSTFWNPGYITNLAAFNWQGKPALIVGGVHNEHKTAFLAVVDPAALASFGPATTAKYACADCEGGAPPAYLLFPRTLLARAREALPFVERLEADLAGQVMVGAQQAEPSVPACVYYHLTRDLAVDRTDISQEYLLAHRELEARRILLRPFDASEEAEARQVRTWDGRGFVPLSPRSRPRR